ncbi:MAG: hypothetical protein JJT96_02890 [Opitutales bacterium]|nr:hypothetical protein [Opitutales bacterium]
MEPIEKDEIGILPPGALGVAYFQHLSQRVADRPPKALSLWVREGSASGDAFRQDPHLHIRGENGVRHTLDIRGRIFSGIAACAGKRPLPAVFLVATLPDQIIGVLKDAIAWLESIWSADQWLPPAPPPFPALVLTANGIYFQRIRQVFLELLEESTLLGRLPDLWPEAMPKLVGHLVRGVTIQTGLREEGPGSCVYRPGPPGLTRLAGGSAAIRQALAKELTAGDLRFVDLGDISPTRVEFDKAIINLSGNLLGILAATEQGGAPRPLTIAEILAHPVSSEIPRLVGTVLRIGQSVRAYPRDYTLDAAMANLHDIHRHAAQHCPSSVQRLVSDFQCGRLRRVIPPTEQWLLDPLLKYARAADLAPERIYLENLARTLLKRFGQLARMTRNES